MNYFLFIVLFIQFVFTQSFISINSLTNNDFIKDGHISIYINSTEEIKAIQFDIKYNKNHHRINKDNITSLISNINFYTNFKDDNIVSIVLFSLNENSIIKNSDINLKFLNIIFEPNKKYTGTTDIEINNILLLGSFGQTIESDEYLIYEMNYTTPNVTMLSNIFPNPFNISTQIEYQLSNKSKVSIIIYNLQGYEIKKLINEKQDPGYYSLSWNGKDNYNLDVYNGKYIIKMIAHDYIYSDNITLLR